MIRGLYRTLLAACRIRGLNRFDRPLRSLARPRVDVVRGLRLELDLTESSQIELFSGYVAEPMTLALIERLLAPGDVMVDVGAHVGLHALTAARRVGGNGRVIAIEPQPECAGRILTNAGLNGMANVLVISAAAGARDGQLVLHDQRRSDRTRLSLAAPGPEDLAARFEAPVVRLDTLLARHGVDQVKLLKVDVEGFEAEVLAGAKAALASTDHVIFEQLPGAEERAARLLADQGFDLKQIDGGPWRPGDPALENNVWAERSAQPLRKPVRKRRTGGS